MMMLGNVDDGNSDAQFGSQCNKLHLCLLKVFRTNQFEVTARNAAKRTARGRAKREPPKEWATNSETGHKKRPRPIVLVPAANIIICRNRKSIRTTSISSRKSSPTWITIIRKMASLFSREHGIHRLPSMVT